VVTPTLSPVPAPSPAPRPAAAARASGLWDLDFSVPADENLVDRIKWTTLARVVSLTVVLAFAIAMDLGLGPQALPPVPETGMYRLTTAFYLLSFLVLLATQLLQHSRRLTRLAGVSIAIDVLLALALVAVTDGLSSVFLFACPLAVLNSALLLYRIGAIAAATLSLLGLTAMAAMQLSWLPWSLEGLRVGWLHTVTLPPVPSGFEIATQLAVQAAAVYATAFLSSHLVRELDRARRRSLVQRTELTRLQVRYADVVSSLPDGLLTVAPSGVITGANPAALRILSLAEGELVGKDLHTVLPGLTALDPKRDTPVELEITRATPAPAPSGAPDNLSQTREIRLSALSGAPQVLACRRAVLREPHGPAGTLVVFRDVTSARGREEAHRNRERLAAIGTMATAVAHEIRNPLASISGAVQMLQTQEGMPPTERQLMAIVVRETHQLSDWIGEFLDFARPRPLQLGPCDLQRLLGDAIEACRQDPRLAAGGVELRAGAGWADAAQVFTLPGDAVLLRQAVWNLLLNAVQAVQSGDRRVVEASLAVRDDQVELAVEDSGPGVDPADIAHVFEPFYTTKGEGTGLGLATVQRHITAHRGEVRVERSVRLGGARFVLCLPRQPATSDVFADQATV